MSQVGQLWQITGHLYLYAKSQGTSGDDVIILFSHLNRESKYNILVIISSLVFI